MTSQPSKGYLAIDIEKAGAQQKHSLLAIGVCLGDDRGNVIAKQAFCFAVPAWSEFEPRCLTEFWNKPDNLAVLARIRSESKSDADTWFAFNNFLIDAEQRFPNQSLVLVSDNPSFDISHLDSAREAFTNLMPIRFTHGTMGLDGTVSVKGLYRWIVDPSERLEALGRYQEAKRNVSLKAVHDHYPSNDAEFIYYLQIEADRMGRELQVKRNQVDTSVRTKREYLESLYTKMRENHNRDASEFQRVYNEIVTEESIGKAFSITSFANQGCESGWEWIQEMYSNTSCDGRDFWYSEYRYALDKIDAYGLDGSEN